MSSRRYPEGHPRHFHAHVYFKNDTQDFAGQVRERVMAAFSKESEVRVYKPIPRPVGPHPVGMFEIDFPKSLFTDVVLWLERERGDLSVLVHELTGDERYDHTQAALWLGKQLPLNLSIFK